MLSLSLFSSSKSVSVSISNKEKIIRYLEKNDDEINKSNHILSLIEEILKSYKITDFENIIFPRGPGGFTSIRSIISISQGLSIGTNIKLLTVDTFQIFLSEIEPTCGLNIIFFQESRNDFYFKFFYFEKGRWLEKSKICSGLEKDIKKKIFDFSEKNNPVKITFISNSRNNQISTIPNTSFLVKKINAKSVSKCFFKKYTKSIIKPIYHHPHYGKKY